MGVLEDVMEAYPTLAFLLGDPEIGPLLQQAVDPNQGFSPQTFQSKLYQTNWWKTKSSSQREWLIKAHTDPGTANQERGSYRSSLALAASQYGVRLTDAQLRWLTEIGLARGMDPTGHEMVYELSKLRNASNATPGAMRTTAREVQRSMRRDYGYQMSNKHAAQWADWIVRGVKTADDMRTTVAGRAGQLYPQYKTGLDQGFTIADLTDGYREIIASELELDPERIDFSEGRWSKVLSWKDGKDGPLRVPTAEEVRKLARQDERWWKTSHGRQTDASMSRNFLALFGKRASMGMS